MARKHLIVLALVLTTVFALGCIDEDTPLGALFSNVSTPSTVTELDFEVKTFNVKENASICTVDGKPVVRLYSTTWCPHCKWVKDAYESVVQGYVDDGRIVAYHWEFDANDDALTPEVEGSVPEEEKQLFNEFNPRNSIPTFVFGCKYYRVGNGYESQQNLTLEGMEFKAVIEQLLSEA